ncbi:hypothetical protein IFM89_030480 [Coptis chinensis]|uniref:Uncharacterized protein n=1 Tax=Coptis chinensis TaxID=261450 RepID=A0A835H817_9MAGN|nr:hypothetical protein IFM89_030480 [Coptis chinensis]
MEEAMMYCMEYIHDGNLGNHKTGRRVIMNENIESAHPMDEKGKQYVLPNVEYQQVRKWVLMHSPKNVEWEEGSQAKELDYIPWLRLQLQNQEVSVFKRIVDGPSFTAMSYNRYTGNGDLSRDNWYVVLDAPKRLSQEIDAYGDPLVFEARTRANDSSSTTLLEDVLEVAKD